MSAVNTSSFIFQIYILVKNCSWKTSEKNQKCSELLVILTDHRLRDHFRPLKYLIWHISYSCSCIASCQTVVSDNTIKGKRNRIDVVIYHKLQPSHLEHPFLFFVFINAPWKRTQCKLSLYHNLTLRKMHSRIPKMWKAHTVHLWNIKKSRK